MADMHLMYGSTEYNAAKARYLIFSISLPVMLSSSTLIEYMTITRKQDQMGHIFI